MSLPVDPLWEQVVVGSNPIAPTIIVNARLDAVPVGRSPFKDAAAPVPLLRANLVRGLADL
jgi:hypothetical protein